MIDQKDEAEAQAPEQAAPAAVIYVGPAFSRLGLQPFQVFKGGAPASAASEPSLASLFVSPESLRAARAALAVEGSPEWSAYRDALVASRKRGA